jgi:hypothetical protein
MRTPPGTAALRGLKFKVQSSKIFGVRWFEKFVIRVGQSRWVVRAQAGSLRYRLTFEA